MSFAPLQLADGPECPSCGCQDAEILRPTPSPDAENWWDKQGSGLAVCRNCRNQFTFRATFAPIAPPPVVDEALAGMAFEPADIEPVETSQKPCAVPFPVGACPYCQARKPSVTSAPKQKPGFPRIRYHKCKSCGVAFKSTES